MNLRYGLPLSNEITWYIQLLSLMLSFISIEHRNWLLSRILACDLIFVIGFLKSFVKIDLLWGLVIGEGRHNCWVSKQTMTGADKPKCTHGFLIWQKFTKINLKPSPFQLKKVSAGLLAPKRGKVPILLQQKRCKLPVKHAKGLLDPKEYSRDHSIS